MTSSVKSWKTLEDLSSEPQKLRPSQAGHCVPVLPALEREGQTAGSPCLLASQSSESKFSRRP